MKALVINGPNLNMLGIREPGIYGSDNYDRLVQICQEAGAAQGFDEVEVFQSNHEGSIVDKIQEAYGKVDGIVLTGGVSHDPRFVSYVTERVGWIAPVKVYAGDFEMDALAAGAIRALDGKESVMTYTGDPSWKGFTCEGALPDVEG